MPYFYLTPPRNVALYDNYKWPSVNRVVDYALVLIIKRREKFLHRKQISSTNLDTEKRNFLEVNECV